MDNAGNVTEDGEADVDEEVAAATALKEDADRWQEDGDDDFADITKMQKLSVRVRRDRGIAGMQAVAPNFEQLDLRSGERHCGVCGIRGFEFGLMY